MKDIKDKNTGNIVLKGTDLLRAIDLANLIRSVGDHEPINDLLPGIPNDPENCVLAATFNCNCFIKGADLDDHFIKTTLPDDLDSGPNMDWYAWFEEKKYAAALAGELNEKLIEATDYAYDLHADDYDNRETTLWGVRLSQDVGQIAGLFDDGFLIEYEKKII